MREKREEKEEDERTKEGKRERELKRGRARQSCKREEFIEIKNNIEEK